MSRRFWLTTLGVVAAAAASARLLLWPLIGPAGGPPAPERFDGTAGVASFVDMTSEAGFHHVHHKPYLDSKLDPIMPWLASVGAAAAAGDFDNDGWTDLYVTDSHKHEPNHLYHNRGDGTFIDVAVQAGVAHLNDESGVSTDCLWGDYDNDGALDLFIVQWGDDRLLRNNGDGTFTNVTARAFRNEEGGLDVPWANGCAATWVDYDRDGWLDIYVGNYFAPRDLWHLEDTRIMHDSFERARNAGRNSLFHNNRDGTFTDVARKLGVDDAGWTLSVGHGDVDNNGWPDIYCADDFGPDQLFLNRGDGTFRNVSEEAIGSDTKKGMNVDFGDVDGDGWLDIYVTNITTADYLKEGNMLWHNDASGEDGVPVFMDIAMESNTFDGGWGWGAKFFDFDNDGDLDIVSVNGFITAGEGSYWYDLASWTVRDEDVAEALNWPPIGTRSFSGNEAVRLWRNDGGRGFTEIAGPAGLTNRGDGRGAVVFDYDNDGDLDLYIANQGMEPVFYRNEIGAGGHRLAIRLVGNPAVGSNRDAIGSRVTIATASGRQIRELDGGNSFCGQSDRRVYFGLAHETVVGRLEVRWPSGRIQVLENVQGDRALTIEEPINLPATASMIPTERASAAASKPEDRPESQHLSKEEGEALLSQLEEQVRARLDDVALASRYRSQCVTLGEHERSTGFFEGLALEHPAVPNIRLQLAAAYIDRIPTCGGMAAIVCKGKLARRALDQTDMLIEADPTWWPAVYSRAMNHLHWPRALRHSDDAAADFRRLIEIQAQGGEANARSYHARAYVGLGDALVKDGDFAGGRRAWQAGLERFRGDPDLMERVALDSAEAARAFVEAKRSLDRQIDTDFSFLLSP